MAFGDIGGPVTELILTCRTPESGVVAIRKGDALKLIGDYTVTNEGAVGDPVFGQALTDCTRNSATVSVRVRGVCEFAVLGMAPQPNGATGVVMSGTAGVVRAPSVGAGRGIVLRAIPDRESVDVLI